MLVSYASFAGYCPVLLTLLAYTCEASLPGCAGFASYVSLAGYANFSSIASCVSYVEYASTAINYCYYASFVSFVACGSPTIMLVLLENAVRYCKRNILSYYCLLANRK